MAFSMNKSQNQATSATSADVVEFGKNKFELEQFILRNLNNALNINDESSYLNSFDIKVASNDSGVFYVPNLPVSYSLSKKLYFDIFAIFAGILYPFKTLPNMARAFFFPWIDGVPTRLKIDDLQTFIKEKVSEKHIPIMENHVGIDMTKVVHVAISGSSGQGKTHFVKYLIYCLKSITNQIICIDPKLSDIYLLAKELNLEVFSPTKGSNLNSFISECNALLAKIITILYQRQEILLTKPDTKFERIYIVIDELLALVQGSSKQAREAFSQLLGTIALLGRQTNISLILLSQRFDATAFGGNTAVREQINCICILGEVNANTCQFLLPNTNVDNIVVPAGIGTGIIKFTDSEHRTHIMPLLTPTYAIRKEKST